MIAFERDFCKKAYKDDNDKHPVVIGGVNQKLPAATLVSFLL